MSASPFLPSLSLNKNTFCNVFLFFIWIINYPHTRRRRRSGGEEGGAGGGGLCAFSSERVRLEFSWDEQNDTLVLELQSVSNASSSIDETFKTDPFWELGLFYVPAIAVAPADLSLKCRKHGVLGLTASFNKDRRFPCLQCYLIGVR